MNIQRCKGRRKLATQEEKKANSCQHRTQILKVSPLSFLKSHEPFEVAAQTIPMTLQFSSVLIYGIDLIFLLKLPKKDGDFLLSSLVNTLLTSQKITLGQKKLSSMHN
jgi:hypothetical protein